MQAVDSLGNAIVVQSLEPRAGLHGQLPQRAVQLVRPVRAIGVGRVQQEDPHLGLQLGALVPALERHGGDRG